MKDLTHYFNSPLSSTKKSENESLVDEKTPKMNKKVRKKALKLDKLTPPEAEDNAVGVQQIEVLPNNDVGAEVVVQEQGLVNGDSSFIDVDCNKGSGKKKKKRKLSPSCEDTSKRTKRKVAKGRLKIIDISSNSPDSSNSPQPQSEKPSKSGLARDILVNSLVVEKLSSLLRDKEEDYEDDGYEIEDDSEKDEDYNCKKVKRKRKKRKSSRRKSVENGGNKEAVVTPLRNGNEATDKTEEEIIKLVELEPVSEKRNSLFMYYSKVDKTVKNLERTSEKIKVQALVHTPPSEKRRPSNGVITPSASVKASLKKKFSRLQKEFMKATDAIEVVSSEEIVQSQTSEVKQNSNSCDSLLNNSDSCGLSQLGVRTISDWKIQLNSSLNKSESVNTDDDNEPANSNANNTLDTPGKNESNDKELPLKRKRKPNKKYIDTVDDCENSSEATTKRVKPVKRQSKLKISPPYSTVDLDDSSNDSVCEARTVRESTSNRNFNTSAKIGLNEKSSAGLMAKFLGKSLVCSPKESAPKIEKVDPSVLIARQKFLKSGLPDDFRQKIASQIEENIPDPPPFPSVSHVQQRDPMRLIWNIPEPRLKLGPSPAVDLEVTSDWQTLFPETEDLIADQSTDVVSLQKIRNKSFIKEFVRTKANTQPSINNRWTLMKNLKSAGVDSACWTDIYKPKTSHDILANKSSVERFKLWLETYKNTAVKQAGDEGSSDEFVHSSDESSTPPKERICIISGPIGCGKTSTVYAVAQELGYKVLEVNASHNRNGKKVTADLSEATQSHQVEHGSLKDIFNNDRKVKKKKKTKNKAANNDVSSKKRSLILVEEADILFEGFDDGFIPAIAALSLTSKRPMVFAVNNKKAQHFSKFVKPSDLMLEFHRPSSSNLASWLQLIALSEGVHLNDSHAERIAQWSNDDVRKSIVQLQFLAQSCESTAQWPSHIDRARWPSAVMDDDVTAEDDVITEDIATKDDVITKNNISTKDDVTTEDGATTENDVTTSTRSKSEIIASLRQVARRSDSLVVGDLLATWCNTGSCDPCPRPEHCVGQASTALNETAAPEKSGGRQTNYFAENILKHVGLCVASDVRSPRNRWKSDSNLKAAVPLLVRCSHSATYSDYLPTLRFFGKCEDLRLSAYTRRNRNFNYLQGLGVNTGDGLTFDAFS